MLFNSHIFLFAFLPIVCLSYHILIKTFDKNISFAFLFLASLFFYAWWNPIYLALICSSILFNFFLVRTIDPSKPSAKKLLIFGIASNLSCLLYFKYSFFIIGNINSLLSSHIPFEKVILPLAISFFTFQQITYLVDTYKGEIKEHSFLAYGLYVTFFPQLIAGPIVHHREMLPQFKQNLNEETRQTYFAQGLSLLCIGLFKKVILADSIAAEADPIFKAADEGEHLSLFTAWYGALAYTFQIYFDFSGYSDMALGIARMFGICLPLNFFSPYKANNIIDFWRRWHMTLSRFLKEYLYIPLGGNRKGPWLRYRNLWLTMLLGGLWHGASWTFVFWGALHGFYLSINHAWQHFRQQSSNNIVLFISSIWISRPLTFVCVIIAWVFFRCDSFDAAKHLLRCMLSFQNMHLPHFLEGVMNQLQISTWFHFEKMPLCHKNGFLLILSLWLISWFSPNAIQYILDENKLNSKPSLFLTKKWQAGWISLVLCGSMAAYALLSLSKPSVFLYFQF